MAKYRDHLPQLDGGLFLTHAGIETYLMYKRGFTFPHFCLFHLLNDPVATDEIRQYCRNLLEVASAAGAGMILCGIHYRASRDWGRLLGYSPEALAAINAKGIELYREVAADHASEATPVVISGCIGPRGDAYRLDHRMSAAEAQDYHAEQVATLRKAGADQITGMTLSDPAEAIGLARAAKDAGMPVAISFTLDAEARLATGPTLAEAIAMVDDATDSAPAYYLINCTHPDDFAPALEPGDWIHRLRGILPNASPLSKGVLCQLGHLEEGDPVELGRQMGGFARRFPHINVWGGCCGTDHAHLAEICRNLVGRPGTQPSA